MRFALMVAILCISVLCGLAVDKFVFHSFSLNYLLIGMAFSATVANSVPEEEPAPTLKLYSPILNLSLVIVIANLGMSLDYRLIAGAGLFTAVYIISRAAGKIGGAYLGGKNIKSSPCNYEISRIYIIASFRRVLGIYRHRRHNFDCNRSVSCIHCVGNNCCRSHYKWDNCCYRGKICL